MADDQLDADQIIEPTEQRSVAFCLLSTPDRASNFIIRSFSCLGASLAYLFSLCQRPLLWGYASCMRHDAIYRDI